MSVCLSVYGGVFVYIYKCVCVCEYVCVYLWVYVCVCGCVCEYISVGVCLDVFVSVDLFFLSVTEDVSVFVGAWLWVICV